MHTTAAAVSNEDKEPYLTVGRGATERNFGINSVGHQQIATHTGIPAAYYKKMVEEAPDLLATNVNRWFAKYPANRMVRTLDNHVRAFLSDSYRPLENADLAEAVLPVLFDLKLEVMSCEVTETRLYLKCVDERIKQDVPSGRKMGDGSHCFFDTVSPAIIISNSEVGLGSLSVESGVFTKVCTNLMAISGAGMKKRHLGARTSLGDGEAIRHLLTDETKRATDRAVWMQVRDVVKGAFEEARFEAHCNKLKGLAEQKIEGDPVKVVELSSKKLGIQDGEQKSVLRHLIEGSDLSRYGLLQAVTRTAADIESYDRASDFERMGGALIDLSANDWQALSIEECTSIPTGIEAHRYFEATQHGDLKWSGWTCIYDDETI
jgi:hypothetical protein